MELLAQASLHVSAIVGHSEGSALMTSAAVLGLGGQARHDEYKVLHRLHDKWRKAEQYRDLAFEPTGPSFSVA